MSTGRQKRTVSLERTDNYPRAISAMHLMPNNAAVIDDSIIELTTGRLAGVLPVRDARVIRVLNESQLLVYFDNNNAEGVQVVQLPQPLLNDTLGRIRSNQPFARVAVSVEMPPADTTGPGDLSGERKSLLPQGTKITGKKRPLVTSALDPGTMGEEQAEQESLRIQMPLIEALAGELELIYTGAPGRGGLTSTQFEAAVNSARRSAVRMENAMDNVTPYVQEAYREMVSGARDMTEHYLNILRYDRARRAVNRKLDPLEALKDGDQLYITQFMPEMSYLKARFDGLNRKYGERTP
jgi:hypothetical protein